MYASVLLVKLRTFHEIYLAAPVYYCCVLGFFNHVGFIIKSV